VADLSNLVGVKGDELGKGFGGGGVWGGGGGYRERLPPDTGKGECRKEKGGINSGGALGGTAVTQAKSRDKTAKAHCHSTFESS